METNISTKFVFLAFLMLCIASVTAGYFLAEYQSNGVVETDCIEGCNDFQIVEAELDTQAQDPNLIKVDSNQKQDQVTVSTELEIDESIGTSLQATKRLEEVLSQIEEDRVLVKDFWENELDEIEPQRAVISIEVPQSSVKTVATTVKKK